jgi:hypothetical protein
MPDAHLDPDLVAPRAAERAKLAAVDALVAADRAAPHDAQIRPALIALREEEKVKLAEVDAAIEAGKPPPVDY